MPIAPGSTPPGPPADDRELRLLAESLQAVQERSAAQLEKVRQLNRIGIALSAERDIDTLLEMILENARRLTGADAGTLYTVNDIRTHLDFRIVHNDTLGIRQGGTSGVPVTLAPVPLKVGGAPNHANVSSHVAITGQAIAFPDVGAAEGFDFSGTRAYDASTGYTSVSMLVAPLVHHDGSVIGVLQLLNAKDPRTGQVRPFPEEELELAASLGSQAAVALSSARLLKEVRDIFHSFIRSIATAIDCKSPYTGGHIRRVVTLTMLLAEQVNAETDGPFGDRMLSREELEELRLAAWLHDVGKIATPEHVVDKHTRLETVADLSHLVAARFDLARKCLEGRGGGPCAEQGDDARAALAELAADRAFVLSCTDPGRVIGDADVERLERIAARRYRDNGEEFALLSPWELESLSVRRGTLTSAERVIVERHAVMTRRILEDIPFPRKLARVPAIAASHHEKLDGSGYPDHLRGEEISFPARILAIADIFEALTAKDRPYKQSMSLAQALDVLERMRQAGHIDPDLHGLFVRARIGERYIAQEYPGGPDAGQNGS